MKMENLTRNKPLLKRYWIELTNSPEGFKRFYGVTAYTLDDALSILEERMFPYTALPSLVSFLENIDVRLLDANHVRPNMESPVWRGIWYPMGFQEAQATTN